MGFCVRFLGTSTTLFVIGRNGPLAPALAPSRDVGPACSSTPGATSSEKTICATGVFEGALALYRPPKARRRSEVLTPSDAMLSFGCSAVGPLSDT